MTKLKLNEYMKIIRVMILLLSINITHLLSNEDQQEKKIYEVENIESLKPSLSFLYIIACTASLVSLSINLSKGQEFLMSLYFHLLGIYLNLSTKPKGWYLSIYDKTNPAFDKQGKVWCVSMAMFLGEIMTFAHSPYWINILKDKSRPIWIGKVTSFGIVSLGASYLIRNISRMGKSL